MIILAEAKLQLNIDALDTTHDVELQSYVDAAIGAVEKHTGELGDVRTISGERHQVCHTGRLWLHRRPVQSLTSLARIDGTLTWDPVEVDVGVDSGLLRVLSGPLFHGLLAATYEAGTVPIPASWNLAARIIVQHLWQTQRGAMGNRRPAAVMGDTTRNLVNVGGRGYAIPNAALELLGEPVPVVA